MATVITPSVETLVNTGTQNLFTVGTLPTIPAVSGNEAMFPAMLGAIYYDTVTSPQQVTFSAVTANVGTDITSNVTTGVFNIAGTANIAYQLNGFVNVTGTPATYGWVNTDTNAAIGPIAQAGTPLSTTYYNTTGNTVSVALRVQSVNNVPFAYPTQIQGAAATVTEVSGYTVA